ncbi:MAG: PspC domain-containing protein [Schleiferiaceae bacterium]|jgi:phage shock protein PspC (stress-responsive transcriptional regulator)|nr:PspC domain-containing protein [Schleiferiaceae bacterium]
MNKTININLAGIIFHLDEEAYKKLTAYLQSIKDRLKGDPGQEEIVADIEARIAELFQEELSKNKEVINMADVETVISVLGSPEDYETDEDEDDSYSKSYSSKGYQSTGSYSKSHSFGRKLFRDEDDKVLGGVASGLGAYFGIDAVWIRLIWAASFFFWGTGFLLYIILWIVIPAAKTTTQKLQMKGEPINVSNIERSVKNVGEKVERMANDPNLGDRIGNFVERLVDALVRILRFALRIALKLLGVALLFLAVILLIAFVGAIFGHEIIVIDNMFGMHDVSGYIDHMLVNPEHHTLLIIGIILMAAAPIVWLVTGGMKLLFNYQADTKIPLVSSALVSLAGLVVVGYIAMSLGRDFRSHSKVTKVETLENVEGGVYYLAVNDMHPYEEDELGDELDWTIGEDAHYRNDVTMNVGKSDKGTVFVRMIYSANGRTKKEAKERANVIQYEYEQNDSLILFNDFIKLAPEEKYRRQELHIRLYIPLGTSIFLNHDMEDIIDDIDNVTNTYDGHMLGHTWLMTQNGLVCTDCDDEDFSEEGETYFDAEDWEAEAQEHDEARKELEMERQRLQEEREIEELQLEIEKLKEEKRKLERDNNKSSSTRKTKLTSNQGFHTPLYILPVNSPSIVEHNLGYTTQV